MTVLNKVHQLEEDFLERKPPFDKVVFPEERLIKTLPSETMEERAILSYLWQKTHEFTRGMNATRILDQNHNI